MDGKHAASGSKRSRRALLSTAALGGAGALGGALLKARSAGAGDAKPVFMFVQLAEDLDVDPAAGTLRLVNVSPQVVYFSDRPERIGGHIKLADYMSEWTPQAGADNFATDPPNAALSVYEPDQPDNSLAIVEIQNPRAEGADLIYDYKVVEGSVPEGGGATALFIDRIGLGGGVGVGYHGVGVGLRGPGLR